jgi:Ni/Co efflux regulator RcnB
MKKALAIAMIGATLLSGTAASAQVYGGYGDRDRDGVPNRYDRHDNRNDSRNHQWRYYGGNYGYDGYRGPWRTGQRFNHYRDRGYYIDDYRAYGLPAPRAGYRYYRDDNGDIVMAAIASGVIGLIVGNALAH